MAALGQGGGCAEVIEIIEVVLQKGGAASH